MQKGFCKCYRKRVWKWEIILKVVLSITLGKVCLHKRWYSASNSW